MICLTILALSAIGSQIERRRLLVSQTLAESTTVKHAQRASPNRLNTAIILHRRQSIPSGRCRGAPRWLVCSLGSSPRSSACRIPATTVADCRDDTDWLIRVDLGNLPLLTVDHRLITRYG